MNAQSKQNENCQICNTSSELHKNRNCTQASKARENSKNKINCKLVKLNKGGYDENGQYFGINHGDTRLYVISDMQGYPLAHKRAASRNEAIEAYKVDCLIYGRSYSDPYLQLR